jgi:hypothetical protein
VWSNYPNYITCNVTLHFQTTTIKQQLCCVLGYQRKMKQKNSYVDESGSHNSKLLSSFVFVQDLFLTAYNVSFYPMLSILFSLALPIFKSFQTFQTDGHICSRDFKHEKFNVLFVLIFAILTKEVHFVG